MSKLDEVLTPNFREAIKQLYLELIAEAEKEWDAPKYTKLRQMIEEL